MLNRFYLLFQTLKLEPDSSAISDKLNEEFFFSLNNPIISTFLILISVIAVIFIINKYVIIPMRKRFLSEKKELKHQHTRLMATLAELDPEPVFRFDSSGVVLMANQAGLNLYGKGTPLGKELSSVIPEIINFEIVKCIENGEQFDFVSLIKNKYFKFTIIGIPDVKIGQIYGSDVTKLKEAEKQLKSALKIAEESEKIKSFFLAQISHEIRSPLTAIMGYNSLIKEDIADKIDKDLEYAFDAIDYSSKRLKRTIDQILNMSLLHAGKYELHTEPVDVASIMEDIITEYKLEIRQRKINLNYSKICDDSLINADRYSLIQIFSNIVDNAIKYTKKGGVEIIVGRDQLKRLFVNITDTGIGMSEEYISNLFVPFTQESMGYNRPYEGNGLGMALIKRFSDLNKVELNLQSEKNIGTSLQLIFSN
jgi:signal transduction histidine kinase